MGVYIPNMSKPTSCKECPFTCEALQFFNGTDIPQSCPLIEIVTCVECKWCDDKGKGRALICTNPYIDMDIHPLDFCSYGEPRESEYVAKD